MLATTVVGAGIVGASVAHHLARAGSRVTVLDKALPGSGATAESFAWIGRGPADVGPEQATLRAAVTDDYRRLERELPGVHVRWTGSLTWGAEHPVAEEAQLHDQRVVTGADARALEPALVEPPAAALHTASDGAVDPGEVIAALLDGARAHGATVRTGVAVVQLRLRGRRVTGAETTDGFLASDTAVVTAGADAPQLCAPLGLDLPVAPSPAVLVRFSAPPELVRTLVSNDTVEVRQAADGTLLAASAYEGQTTAEQLRVTGEEVLRRVRSTFSGAADVRLIAARVGMRPMPVDGSPVIGPVPGVAGAYLAVMHSGVTLAASVGRLVAAEVVTGVDAAELRDLRPARFAAAPR